MSIDANILWIILLPRGRGEKFRFYLDLNCSNLVFSRRPVFLSLHRKYRKSFSCKVTSLVHISQSVYATFNKPWPEHNHSWNSSVIDYLHVFREQAKFIVPTGRCKTIFDLEKGFVPLCSVRKTLLPRLSQFCKKGSSITLPKQYDVTYWWTLIWG